MAICQVNSIKQRTSKNHENPASILNHEPLNLKHLNQQRTQYLLGKGKRGKKKPLTLTLAPFPQTKFRVENPEPSSILDGESVKYDYENPVVR
ncbi:hypothetical protein NIES3275_12760 [Microchaete diplosiphon NIES-3275]|nr:hypothetical protein NIES3275_12760 [Microchaete diplosiphon NIES-3275]